MVTIAKKSTILLSLLVLLTFHSLHAQSDFISVNTSANTTTANLAADGDATTGETYTIRELRIAYVGGGPAESAGTRAAGAAGPKVAATLTSTDPRPVAGTAQLTSKPWLNGDETVSANTVQAWSLVPDMAQDARWGRCEETFGEDPRLVSEISGAWIIKQYIL